MQWFGTLSKSAHYKYICILGRQGVMRLHDQNATRMQNVQYGRKRETGPKRGKKKAESTKLNVVPETFTQRSSLPGPRREGGSRLREKWAHDLFCRHPVQVYVHIYRYVHT